MNFQIFKPDLEKAEEPEIKLPTSIGIIEKSRVQKNFYFCFIDYAKSFDCVDHKKLWTILKGMEIPDLPPEKLVCRTGIRTECGTTDWLQMEKGVCQDCILSPCLFNLRAEYIMQKLGWMKHKTGIKIAGRNINKLRYAYDITFVAKSQEEIKSLLMKVKQSEKFGLKLNIQKTKIMASHPIT